MTRQPVTSSNLASIGFEIDNAPSDRAAGPLGVMEVEFKGGRVYQYDRVPFDHFTALMDLHALAEAGDPKASVGRYFIEHVRNDYFCRRVS